MANFNLQKSSFNNQQNQNHQPNRCCQKIKKKKNFPKNREIDPWSEDLIDHGKVLRPTVNCDSIDKLKKHFEKYFGYLARCEGKLCIWTLKIENCWLKWDENAETDSAKI